MKLSCLRLTEIAAATVLSSAVLLVAVTPAVFGAQSPARHGHLADGGALVQLVVRAPGLAPTV
jgi:hypothetical protein